MKLCCRLVFLLLLTQLPVGAQETRSTTPDSLSKFNEVFPIFKLEDEQYINSGRFLRFSTLTSHRKGVKPFTGGPTNFNSIINKEQGTLRIYMINLSIQDMLTHGFYKSNRVILEVQDPSKYRYKREYGDSIKWSLKNTYCFELLYPIGVSDGVQFMNDELSRYFKLKFGVQERLVDALVLTRIGKKDRLRSKGKGEGYYDFNGYFNNIPLSRLGHPIGNALLPPFVDETGYKENVDLNLHVTDWTNIPSLKMKLNEYGLDINIKKRMVQMFVITETK